MTPRKWCTKFYLITSIKYLNDMSKKTSETITTLIRLDKLRNTNVS